MENQRLFEWDDADHAVGPALMNAVRVRRAGPLDVLVETQHGPSHVVVKLPHPYIGVLRDALTEHLDATQDVVTVAGILRREGYEAHGAQRLAARVVDALREDGLAAPGADG